MAGLSPKNERQLRLLIAKHQLDPAADPIVQHAELCYPCWLGKRENYAAKGNSRYGGVPDLPASMPWPRSTQGCLNFLMQVNLQELPLPADSCLPCKGILYFFIESDDTCTTVSGKVLYFDGRRTSLKKSAAPPNEELAHQEHYQDLAPYQLASGAGVSIPSYGSKLFQTVAELALPTSAGDGGDRFFKLIDESLGLPKGKAAAAQLLGCPSNLGDDLRENAYLASAGRRKRIYDYKYRDRNRKELLKQAKDWVMLWRINSSSKVGVCIWDAGSLNIMIRKDDLKARDFSKVYLQIETG